MVRTERRALVIPVEWWNQYPFTCNPRQHWDTSWLQAVFAGRIGGDGCGDCFVTEPSGWAAMVVMVAGNFHSKPEDVEALNGFLHRQAPGRVLIVHSDEEHLFPYELFDVPGTRLWVQTPDPDREYPAGTRFFGEGWSPYTPEILAAWASPPRTIEVGFRGQVTHDRRKSMYGSFIDDLGNWPDINATAGFTMGIARAGYLRELATTKVALCPSGPCTPDTFRVWEALEAGCVPLVDDVTPDGKSGYWKRLLGEEPPFPLVTTWSDAPEMARLVLENFDALQHTCAMWWKQYQQRLVEQLRADVAAVRA